MKSEMKKNSIFFVACLAALISVVWLVWPESGGSDAVEKTKAVHRFGGSTPVMRTPKDKIKKVRHEPIVRLTKEKSKKILSEYRIAEDGSIDFGEYDNYSFDDKVLAQTMDKAFWDDDKETALAAVMDASTSRNKELREKAIEKAAWFGPDGMDALASYFSDKDESLAERAREAWVVALEQIGDDETRAAMIEPMCKVVTDPNMVDGMLMSLNSMSHIAQMQTMISLMDSGTEEAAEVARNHYAFVTGEDFTTVEAAQKWLADNWEDADEAYLNGESVEEYRDKKFEKDAYADIDAAAKKLGVSSEQLEEVLGQEADAEEMSGEQFVQQLNFSALQEGMSTTDYLVDRLKDRLKPEESPETVADGNEGSPEDVDQEESDAVNEDNASEN